MKQYVRLQIQALATDFELEYECQDFISDPEYHSKDGEKVGLARVIEALEAGCAPFARTLKDASQVVAPDKEVGDEDEDGDMLDVQVWEELLQKVKSVSENAPNVSDEERRNQAEKTILEVMKSLGIADLPEDPRTE